MNKNSLDGAPDVPSPSATEYASSDSMLSALKAIEPTHYKRKRLDGVGKARMLTIFVLASMLATNAWLIYDARVREIEQAQLGNTNLARAVAERVEGSIGEAEHILNSLVYEIERSEFSPDALERLQAHFVHHVASVEQLEGLSVYDSAGTWVATSEARWDRSLNNSDRAYFIHHRDNLSLQVLVSPPIVSRSSGAWVVPVSRRLVDADGNFAGVALATVSLNHLRLLLERFNVGKAGAITLTLSGRIMLRRPYVEGELSQPAPKSAFSEMAATTRSGLAEGSSPIDGVTRLVSFETTRNYPIRVSVATSKDELLRKWWVSSSLQTAWVAFLCIALWQSVKYVKRSMRSRLKAELDLRDARDALANANVRLAYMAQYDGLTGLPNRRFFDACLERFSKQAFREQFPLAVVMVDVDKFKEYNDLYGHGDGDACLKRVATSLMTVVQRPEDVVARYGGEEMVMLLQNTSIDGALVVAEAARVAVLSLEIAHHKSPARFVSISLGVAAWVPTSPYDGRELLLAADQALYRAKHSGRNKVTAHTPLS